MRDVSPEVFLISRPQVDWESVGRYLASVGGEAWLDRVRDEEGPDGERLVEFMGRMCYRSWAPGLNPNVSKVRENSTEYLRNILRSAHGSVLEHANYSFVFANVSRVFCYDEETEVLTSNGWMPWPKVDGTETFASVEPATGALVWAKATEHFVGDYEGPMYRLQSEQIDLLVTPQHRMWVRKHDTQAARRGEEPWQVMHADELFGKRVHYCKTLGWTGQEEGHVEIPSTTRSRVDATSGSTRIRTHEGRHFPLRPFAEFLGWWLAEGSLNGHQIVIAQNRGSQLERIAQVIRDMGLGADLPVTGPGSVRTQSAALRDWLSNCGRIAHEKRIPEIVHSWGPTIIQAFLEAFVDGDGSRRKDSSHCVIHTTSSEMADQLQVLAMKAGWSANIRVDDRAGLERVMPSGQTFLNQRPCFIVSIVKTRTTPLVNHNGAHNDSWVNYSGKVYCVKVPTGLLVVRRAGKPVVSGNTHELVRHRAGAAISQESLRYVRLADIPFEHPDFVRADPELLEQANALIAAMESFQELVVDRTGIAEDGVDFHTKKTVTSAARRYAPDGVATTIGWTVNIRAIRHVIAMRTDPGAEEEIRRVFDAVATVMQKELPALLGDFVRGEDGAWRPEFPKV